MDAAEAMTPVRVLSTGYAKLDAATGCGGYPRGRIVELLGPQLPALMELAQAAVHAARSERVLVVRPFERLALDLRPGHLPIEVTITPMSALDEIECAARTGKYALIVVDHVGAIGSDLYERPADGEIEGNCDDIAQRTELARRMSRHMRQLVSVASRTSTTVLYVNQTTVSNIPWFYGTVESERTSGGNALKYYASLRVDARLATVETEEESLRVTRCKVLKNKLAPPFVTVDL